MVGRRQCRERRQDVGSQKLKSQAYKATGSYCENSRQEAWTAGYGAFWVSKWHGLLSFRRRMGKAQGKIQEMVWCADEQKRKSYKRQMGGRRAGHAAIMAKACWLHRRVWSHGHKNYRWSFRTFVRIVCASSKVLKLADCQKKRGPLRGPIGEIPATPPSGRRLCQQFALYRGCRATCQLVSPVCPWSLQTISCPELACS